MTDNEIIKALECCIKDDYDKGCTECPAHCYKGCDFHLAKFALSLISRLQAENDKLCMEIDELIISKDQLFDEAESLIKKAKVEAVKEFAERLCEGRVSNDPVVIAVKCELKEMAGED